MNFDIPKNNKEQTLVYKVIGERKIALTFLPPIKEIYKLSPVYFIIPGGGWHEESRESMLDFSALSVQSLRCAGFAAVSIDYRVSDEQGVTMEEIISDCFDAARYISHFSEILKIDPYKFAVSGHSAGGHLSLMLAYAPHDMFISDSVLSDDFSVAVAAPMSAPTILYTENIEPTLGLNADHAFRGNNTYVTRKKTSPYTYVSYKSPPTVLCAGTSDRLVYCNSSELLYKKLIENKVKCKLVLSVGGGHCFEKMHDGIIPSPSREEIQEIITSFIKKSLS